MEDEDKTNAQLIEELRQTRREAAELRDLAGQHEQRVCDLRLSEKSLTSLINEIPDVIYKLDDQGKIVFISDAIKNYGYTPEELVGTNIMDMVNPEDREKAGYRINERRTGERKTRSLEVRFLGKDRASVPFELRSSSTEDEAVFSIAAEGVYRSDEPKEEDFIGTQGVARDITERMRMEKLSQEADRLRVLTETAGAAAHEINQPLQIIIGLCEMLLLDIESEVPPEDKIKDIHGSAKRIAEIVKEMQNIRQYATQHYAGDADIIDFKKATQTPPPSAPDHKHRDE